MIKNISQIFEKFFIFIVLIFIIIWSVLLFLIFTNLPKTGCERNCVVLKYEGNQNGYYIISIEKAELPRQADSNWFDISPSLPHPWVIWLLNYSNHSVIITTVYQAKINYTSGKQNSSILYNDRDNNDKISENDKIMIGANLGELKKDIGGVVLWREGDLSAADYYTRATIDFI